MQLALLSGGLGTRMRPLTDNVPKAMLPVGEAPFIDLQLSMLARRDIHDVVLCVGHLGDQIRAHVGEGARYPLTISISDDGGRPLGTAGALRRALAHLAPWFFVGYGDAYLPCDYRAFGRAFGTQSWKAGIVVFRNENRWDTSNVAVDGERVVRYVKGGEGEGMAYIDAGVLLLRREVIELLEPDRPASLERDVLAPLVAGGRVAAFETPSRFYEIGSLRGLHELRALAASQSIPV
jgi:NDP-sugar pyrophosphorylase family protein